MDSHEPTVTCTSLLPAARKKKNPIAQQTYCLKLQYVQNEIDICHHDAAKLTILLRPPFPSVWNWQFPWYQFVSVFLFFNMGKKQTGQSDVYTAQRTARKLFFQLSCASQKFSGGSGGHVWWIHFLHWQPYVILLCASTPGATNRGNEEKIIKHTLVLTGPLQHYLQRNENIFKLWNTASQMFPPQKKECRPCIYNLTIHL